MTLRARRAGFPGPGMMRREGAGLSIGVFRRLQVIGTGGGALHGLLAFNKFAVAQNDEGLRKGARFAPVVRDVENTDAGLAVHPAQQLNHAGVGILVQSGQRLSAVG